jgi:ATP-dependent DNA helicase DinG
MSATSDALRRLAAQLPGGGEERPQQQAMAEAIAAGIGGGRHVIAQAGTGTGKSWGYLVPAILARRRCVVATATKALQDQLATKDLPFLEAHLGVSFEWAILKGRNNYLCLQRLRELQQSSSTGQGKLELDDMAATVKVEITRLGKWAGTTASGDLAELDWSPSDAAQRAVTVSGDECPGASRCPVGASCFAEAARRRAEAADVIVVNLHLYGLDVASGGAILPEHEVVVVDEAHQLEDVMSDTVGVQIGPGRFVTASASIRRIIDDPTLVGGVAECATLLREVLAPFVGERLSDPLPDVIIEALIACRGRLESAQTALRAIETDVEEAKQRKIRAQQLATRLQEHIDTSVGSLTGTVPFVSGSPEHPRLEIAPLDVGPILAEGVWARRRAVLTSATIPSSLAARVGLVSAQVDMVDVGSPFEYAQNSLLYCAIHLPDPRSPARETAAHEEIAALITAAGGRTLALFTSWKAMDAAAQAVKAKVPFPVITQRDMPKASLVKAFSDDEATCLFATAGFFQGVDIPGRTLSLVIIDKIPFPRPDDPLLSARRELLGSSAFSQIDVPRAAMLLAQATGRLIRTADDRGVVAVLDPRLGTASYRWEIVKALPPMKRTRHRAEVETFLRDLTSPNV